MSDPAAMTVDPSCNEHSGSTDSSARSDSFQIVSSVESYGGYVRVWRRSVRFPDGRTHDWDVAGHARPQPAFVVVFPFFSASRTTRLLREYAQGVNAIKLTFPCGGVPGGVSVEQAVMNELSEEARLRGGRLVRLLPEGHSGISELKWGTNTFLPFIIIDPEEDQSPRPRDPEEYIADMGEDVPVDELMALICKGEVMLPSVQTAVMALAYINQHNL